MWLVGTKCLLKLSRKLPLIPVCLAFIHYTNEELFMCKQDTQGMPWQLHCL